MTITPSGLGSLNVVSLNKPKKFGRNRVEVLNDEPYTVDDGTYQNNE